LIRLPHSAIPHQRREEPRETSWKSRVQSAFVHSFTLASSADPTSSTASRASRADTFAAVPVLVVVPSRSRVTMGNALRAWALTRSNAASDGWSAPPVTRRWTIA